MQSLKGYLSEGRNDPSIFHAIFMAGSPGAGKSHVATLLALNTLGYKEINSDTQFEKYMKDAFLDLEFNKKQQFQRNVTRAVAKRHVASKQRHAEIGRLGLLIDGTAKSVGKIQAQKKELESKGYECAMIYVSTDVFAAIAADKQRERSLGPDLVTSMHKSVEKNIDQFRKQFGKLFFEVDNSNWEKTPSITRPLYNKIVKWSKTMPKNKAAKEWLRNN